METRVVSIPRGTSPLGYFDGDTKGSSSSSSSSSSPLDRLDRWHISPEAEDAVAALRPAAEHLRTRDTPVAFPTETVYGLGADATRSASVRGIYSAKGRPSDNPLIVHVCDLRMLRELLRVDGSDCDPDADMDSVNPLPELYRPLIERFWPGPLTILLPNPRPSRLAAEVTAGLGTFGVRMPSSPLALTLIKLAGVPLAAPSANASTRPSPTTAQHVKDDLDGRIELILDGGACRVGVESTVVDGLCRPPAVLRPGGVGMDDIRSCPGWEGVVKAYKDQSEEGTASSAAATAAAAPRAPGMKYKHYSPRARVVLYEAAYAAGRGGLVAADARAAVAPSASEPASRRSAPRRVGVIRTRRWPVAAGLQCAAAADLRLFAGRADDDKDDGPPSSHELYAGHLTDQGGNVVGEVFDIGLGQDTQSIAQGLFSALRELDARGVDVIFVEGIDDHGDVAAAVMNRLRKAASEIRG
ncbi:hypothetical protein E4U41_006130 [Claviceps citrina]|nr:hypothetical protein E4U41_006130 [Claviceps citrina]